MKRRAQQLGVVVVVSLFVVVLVGAAGRVSSAIQGGESGAGRDAASLFKSKCATCHGKDGRAKTFKAKFNKARNLTNGDWQETVTDERLFNSISNGRGKMPAFGKKFSVAEIESLVAHVRSLKE